MSKLTKLVRRFRSEEDGAAMVEYTVLLGMITVAVIVTIGLVAGWISTQWTTLDTTLNGP